MIDDKLVTDLEDAIKASQENITNGTGLVIADYLKGCKDAAEVVERINTHGIEVEYLQLPVMGLYFEYMFRYSVPFQTVLTTQTIKITAQSVGVTDTFTLLKKEAIARFIEMSNENGCPGLSPDLPCTLVELEVVRKK